MSTVVVKAPSTAPQGTIFYDRDGGSHVVAAGGLLTIDSKYLSGLLAAGYSIPSTFGAVSANLTAAVSGIQANATALSYGLNQVATVASAADAVILPAAVPGEFVTVVNDAANAMLVFATGADTINGVAGATGISQPGNSDIVYSCVVAGQWRAVPQTGFAGASPAIGSTANGVVSNGTSLANGTVLNADISRVTTVGSANGALTLPVSKPGMRRRVTNANGGNTANIFPAVNETINSAGANTSVQLAANLTIDFICAVAGTWDFVKSA